MTPLVSIVIPCLNAEASIERCLASCFGQTYPRIEVLLVDNGSTDGGIGRAQAFAHRHSAAFTLASCPEPGANRARNLGYSLCRGDYVQWLDADDELQPDKISLQVAALERHPGHAIAYGDWRWRFPLPGGDYRRAAEAIMRSAIAAAYGDRRWILVQGVQNVLERRFALRQHDDWLLRMLQDMWLPPHAYLLRRAAADTLHEECAFHPDTRVAMEREYFSIAALLGMRYLHVPEAIADYFTWSATQGTRRHTPALRATQMKTVFERLRKLAEGNPAFRLSEAHRRLLAQSWDPFVHVPAESGQAPRREHRADSAIRGALAASPLPMTLELHAKRIAHTVPTLWERHLRILRALERFAAEGVLRPETGA